MSEERVKLAESKILEMLPEGDTIHTFRGGSILIGCDWPRAQVLEHIKEFGAEIAGERATRMGHGLAVADKTGWLFIETRRATS